MAVMLACSCWHVAWGCSVVHEAHQSFRYNSILLNQAVCFAKCYISVACCGNTILGEMMLRSCDGNSKGTTYKISALCMHCAQVLTILEANGPYPDVKVLIEAVAAVAPNAE